MKAGRANIEIVSTSGFSDPLVIRDLGGAMSVTNDAEGVVKYLWEGALLPPGRRLYYYDSEGQLDELLWKDAGIFVGFAPGPRPPFTPWAARLFGSGT